MYNNISPVNTFRVIFNHYFGTNLPLLKDKSYVPDYHLPENLRGNKKYTPLENFIF